MGRDLDTLVSGGSTGSPDLANLTHLSVRADCDGSWPSLHVLTSLAIFRRRARRRCRGGAGLVGPKPRDLARHPLNPSALGAPQPSLGVAEAPRVGVNGRDGMHGFAR